MLYIHHINIYLLKMGTAEDVSNPKIIYLYVFNIINIIINNIIYLYV